MLPSSSSRKSCEPDYNFSHFTHCEWRLKTHFKVVTFPSKSCLQMIAGLRNTFLRPLMCHKCPTWEWIRIWNTFFCALQPCRIVNNAGGKNSILSKPLCRAMKTQSQSFYPKLYNSVAYETVEMCGMMAPYEVRYKSIPHWLNDDASLFRLMVFLQSQELTLYIT